MKRFADIWGWILDCFPLWHVLAAVLLGCCLSGCIEQRAPTPVQPERKISDTDWRESPRRDARGGERRDERQDERDDEPPIQELPPPPSLPKRNEPWRLHPPAHPELADPLPERADIPREMVVPVVPEAATRRRDPGSNFTGAKVFVWEQGCPIGEWLLADLKANRIGWTCGPGPEFDFWEVRVPATERCPIIRYYDQGRLLPGPVRGYCGPQQLPAIYAKHPHANEDVEQWRSDSASPNNLLSLSGGRQPTEAFNAQPLYAPVYRSAPVQRTPFGPYIGGIYDNHTKVGLNLGFAF